MKAETATMATLIYGVLTLTFVVHGVAFTLLGFMRRKKYYFFLTGTFTFLTALYLMKFEGWRIDVPGTGVSAAALFRVCAMLCSLAYFNVIYNEPGSWLWKFRNRLFGLI
jgi:hypothetical protein